MGGSESSLRKRPPSAWLPRRKPPPSPTVDLTRSIRSYLQTLNPDQLNYLSSTYATLSRELRYYKSAMLARPTPPSMQQELSDLLDYKWNSDVEIQLPAANFLAHKPILMVRSGYFAAHLKSNSIKLQVLDVLGFSELLRFIYTGEGLIDSPLSSFLQLTQIPLESSLLQLYSTRRFSDCLLVWSSSCTQPAHSFILSARSPFLRNLLAKRKQLVLDSSVVPFKYSDLLLFYMYSGRVDLQLMQEDLVTNLQELYHVAQFLEMEGLSNCIESILVEQLNSWPRLLRWANGSQFVQRACLLHIQERWWTIAQSTEYYSLPLEVIEELVRSDFTQCPESELVDSLLRWAQFNGVQLPSSLLGALRLDYITNRELLGQVTRGLPGPSLLMQSRPRYWGPIHEELVGMVGEGRVEEEEGDGEGGGEGEVVVEPEVLTALLQRYEQLLEAEQTPPSSRVGHWLRVRAVREVGLPDGYAKCLLRRGEGGGGDEAGQQREQTPARRLEAGSLRRRGVQPVDLPDIASNIVDPVLDLDLGDRFRH